MHVSAGMFNIFVVVTSIARADVREKIALSQVAEATPAPQL